MTKDPERRKHPKTLGGQWSADLLSPETTPNPGSDMGVYFTLGDVPDTLPVNFIATGFGQKVTYVPDDELTALRLTVQNAEEALRQAGVSEYGTLAEGVRMLAGRPLMLTAQPFDCRTVNPLFADLTWKPIDEGGDAD